MEKEEQQLSGEQSLALITQMINRAKDACHQTGIAAIMWGAVIAVCALVRLAELQFGFKLPVDIYWLTVIAVIPQIWFNIREKKERQVRTWGDEFMDYLWTAFGICIFLLIVILKVLYNNGAAEGTFKMYEFQSALFLLLYGLPTFVSGQAMKFRPMMIGGIFCWICCVASLFTSFRVDLLLIAAAALLAWFVPGIIMERDYRKAKRELKNRHV